MSHPNVDDKRGRPRWKAALGAGLAAAVFVTACGTGAAPLPSPTSTPTGTAGATGQPSRSPSPTPTASARTYSPNDAAQVIRTTVTGARPLLIPNAIPDDWTATVELGSSGFTATYRSADGAKRVTLAITGGNPPLPTDKTTQSHPSFHGDARSLYQVTDGTVATSDRQLLWIETGTWSVPGTNGVPYYLTASGLTDAEFWQIANGLHPNQV